MRCKSAFLVHLKCAFQNKDNLHLVMEYIDGGDLFTLKKNNNRGFNLKAAQFYVAEVLLGIQYLHEQMDIIYRDLKLENIMLSKNGHVKLIDFGLTVKNIGEISNVMAGTLEYMAPEIVTGMGFDKTVDFWSLGVLLYELIAGRPPFFDSSRNLNTVFVLIMKNVPVFSNKFSDEAKSLVQALLKSDPKQRLGANGI